METYTKDSQGATHGHLSGANVEAIFKVERYSLPFWRSGTYVLMSVGISEGEEELYTKASYDKLEDGNRMLLWHGSRTTNFGGILSQGLRIAPPEAPVSGYMCVSFVESTSASLTLCFVRFGKGVYFADASSKSLGYTHHHLSDNTGLLLLCEVATKPVMELDHAAYDGDQRCKAANALYVPRP